MMLFRLAIAILIFLVNLPVHGQQLKLIFTGDIMGHDTQIASALATGKEGYDYDHNYELVAPYFQTADIVIGNLEVTLAGPPYKGYPQFSSPDELADALKRAGYRILLTANNHALDRGRKGLERTLTQLSNRGLVYTGTFRDSLSREISYPLIVEKKGMRLAILNYAYGTNGIKDKPPTLINRIDRELITRDLQKARSAEPDAIIACMHWGSEYQRTENDGQRELAAFLFEKGTDVIIGSHPHVIQPVRGSRMGDLVVYSLGNHISNQRNRYRDGGIAFELVLEKKEGLTSVHSFAYLPLWVYKPETKKGTKFTLVPATADDAAMRMWDMPSADSLKMKQFLEDTRSHLKGVDEILPSWINN